MTAESIPSGKAQKTLASRLETAAWHGPGLQLRLRDFFSTQSCRLRMLKKAYPGIMHLLIFWGVTIQVIGTAINLMQMALFIPFVELPFPRGAGYLASTNWSWTWPGLPSWSAWVWLLTAASCCAPKPWKPAGMIIYAIVLLTDTPMVGFTTEGLRLLAAAPTMGGLVSGGEPGTPMLIGGPGIDTRTRRWRCTLIFVIVHASLGLILIASIPFTKLRHLVTAPLNIVLRDRAARQAMLEKIEDIEETEILGVGKVSEFTSQQLLSFDACLRCGRCEEACPATISGMNYSPQTLMQILRGAMVDQPDHPNGNAEQGVDRRSDAEEYAWACTTCGACLEKCPVFRQPGR